MARDCKVVDRYNYQGPLHMNEPFMYAHLFNGYCFLCANFGHMARDCEVSSRYNYYRQNPRSKFAGSRDRHQTKSSMNNIERYKCHNYGHIAHNSTYKMESTMNERLEDENKKV